jgi:N-acetylneuraminate synthase
MERIVLPAELEQIKKMRRSIVATRDLPAGTVLQSDDLCAKRPGTGLPPDQLDTLPGRKLRNAVKADSLLLGSDLA